MKKRIGYTDYCMLSYETLLLIASLVIIFKDSWIVGGILTIGTLFTMWLQIRFPEGNPDPNKRGYDPMSEY